MKMTSTKRFAVRTDLVTSTTLATVIGAQALASIDEAARAQPIPAPTIAPADPVLQPTTATGQPVSAAVPNVVILRHAGEVSAPAINVEPQAPARPSASVVSGSAAPILPPNPVQIAPPAPVVQQVAAQPAPVTRSSR